MSTDLLVAGVSASHVHRYTSYLSDLRQNESAYLGTRRLPGRNKADKLVHWGATVASTVAVPRRRPEKPPEEEEEREILVSSLLFRC